MSDTDKAEKLLQEAKQQKRHNTDPSTTETTEEPERTLEDAVSEAYHRLDDGDLHENLTVRDADLAALMAGLESTGDLQLVGTRAYQQLGKDEDADTRAAVLKALLRVGLSEVASNEVDAAKEGKRSYLMSQADDF